MNTLSPSHLRVSALIARALAETVENKTRRKNDSITQEHIFLFGVETFGPWGPSARVFKADNSVDDIHHWRQESWLFVRPKF